MSSEVNFFDSLREFGATLSDSSEFDFTPIKNVLVDSVLVNRFVRAIYPEFKNNPLAPARLNEFFRAVLLTSIPVSIWVTHISDVYEWLADRGESAKFSDVLEYVHCSQDISYGESMKLVLDEYGFERAFCLGTT